MNLFHHLKQQHLASVMTVKSCSAAEQTLETQLVTAAEVDPFYFTQYFLIMFFFLFHFKNHNLCICCKPL